jgi:hypothetical protein
MTATSNGRPRERRRGGEQPMVPKATFDSYYGRPVLKEVAWAAPDIPGYLFLGGLAGASSALAACAHLTGNRELARVAKTGAAGAIGLSMAALVNDLGRPARFVNMLRVFKVTSPMSVGSWLLAAYSPAAFAAAGSALTGRLPAAGAVATVSAGVLGTGVATYTAALLCDTAVPAWHQGHREMPYVFAGSAATAAGGLGMLAVPSAHAGPAVRFAVVGAAAELTAKSLLLRRLGAAAEPGRPADGSRRGADRGGAGGRRAGRAQPAGRGTVRGGAAGRLGPDPVRDLRGGTRIGAGPEVHGGTAARAAARQGCPGRLTLSASGVRPRGHAMERALASCCHPFCA